MERGSRGADYARQKVRYFGNFAIRHRAEMRKLVEGRILGKESLGWRNVAEHNLLAGVVAFNIGELVGLSKEDLEEVTSVAATHDWDKRVDKERIGRVEEEIDLELAKTGLVRVTGVDWRDFDFWGIKEKILRYVDSGLIPISDGHSDFVSWRIRLDELRTRSPEIGELVGMKLYGKSAYEKLAEITSTIEMGLHNIALTRNSELGQEYPRPEMLPNLIVDHINRDIEKIRRP